VLDESALQFDQILVSGGKRGLSVGVNPQDLLKVLNAVAAPIGVDDASELDPAWFEGLESVGISSGASVPDELVSRLQR